MSKRLDGQAVVVTGGGSGLGRYIAERLADEGARVHVCDIDAVALDSLRASNRGITTTVADVSDAEAVNRLFKDALESMGRLTGLVNNCGVAGPVGRVETLSPEQWNAAMAINVTGSFLCMQHAIPLLRDAGGGAIVNMSSVAGRVGFALRASYCTTKWAVIGLAKAVAQEAGSEGIRVNAVLPGACDTDRLTRVLAARAPVEGKSVDELRKEASEICALQRLIDPAEVAATVAFLISADGKGITGQAISVCGGAIGS
ncbi:SDR family oxidoreductase [Paraburkholderia sp. RL17-383-BIF-A]|uniref:SDR family oxidoreductase n=1 Tax=Paraburkholderia sp. RL17-383-BIF-A TaxID=3031631 RepID=UPI0038B861AA